GEALLVRRARRGELGLVGRVRGARGGKLLVALREERLRLTGRARLLRLLLGRLDRFLGDDLEGDVDWLRGPELVDGRLPLGGEVPLLLDEDSPRSLRKAEDRPLAV